MHALPVLGFYISISAMSMTHFNVSVFGICNCIWEISNAHVISKYGEIVISVFVLCVIGLRAS